MPTPLEVAILQSMATEDDDYLYFHSLKLLAAQRGYLLVSFAKPPPEYDWSDEGE